jgi:hypothetical protein
MNDEQAKDQLVHAIANPADPAAALADHLSGCRKPDGVIVVDGDGDAVVAELIAAGWTPGDSGEVIAGKRVRMMVPPPDPSQAELFEKYGRPERVDALWVLAALNRPDLDPAGVTAWRYPTVEAANAFAAANRRHHGLTSIGPAVTNGGIVGAVILPEMT